MNPYEFLNEVVRVEEEFFKRNERYPTRLFIDNASWMVLQREFPHYIDRGTFMGLQVYRASPWYGVSERMIEVA